MVWILVGLLVFTLAFIVAVLAYLDHAWSKTKKGIKELLDMRP